MKWDIDNTSQYPRPRRLRTLTANGAQIESRIFEEHKEAVLRAWWYRYENDLLEQSKEKAS